MLPFIMEYYDLQKLYVAVWNNEETIETLLTKSWKNGRYNEGVMFKIIRLLD